MQFVPVKSLGGTNYVRADVVVAIQTNPSGGAVIVMSTGVLVQSSESPKDIAERLEAQIKSTKE